MQDTSHSLAAAVTDAWALIEGGRLIGAIPARYAFEGQIGVAFDGTLKFSTNVKLASSGMMALSVPLVGLTLPKIIDLEELETGRRLLAEPVRVEDDFRLLDLSLDGTTLTGAFALAWAPQQHLPILFISEEKVVARGIARHARTELGRRAIFRFSVSLAVLPLEQLRLHLAVLGRRRPESTVEIDCLYYGYVDEVRESSVTGWLVDRARAREAIAVEVQRAGRVVARTTTQLHRPDVALAVPGAVTPGFEIKIPVIERLCGGAEPYVVVVGGTRTALCGGEVRLAAATDRMNCVDEAVAGLVTGWAVDGEAGGPAKIEVRYRGQALASGVADRFRADLAEAGLAAPGLPPGHCAFSIRLPRHCVVERGDLLDVFANGHLVSGSPRVLDPNPNIARFMTRRSSLKPELLPRLRATLNRKVGPDCVSFIMCPTVDAGFDNLEVSLSSVVAQWCSHWEFLFIETQSLPSNISRLVERFERRDRRIRTVSSAEESNIGNQIMEALKVARFNYITLLKPGYRLEPDAVYHLLRSAKQTRAAAIYTDSYVLDNFNGQMADLELHTAFSPYQFRTAPFTPALLCVRRDLAVEAVGTRTFEEFTDFVLETSDVTAHVPNITVGRPRPTALVRQIEVSGSFHGKLLAVVMAPSAPSWLRDVPFACRVVVVDFRALPTTLNNVVMNAGDCEAILLIGPRLAAPSRQVLLRLAELSIRADVAAVGPVLVTSTEEIVAAGLVLGGAGIISPGMSGSPKPFQGSIRNVSALPQSLVAFQRKAWIESGGFDELFTAGLVGLADLCLRMIDRGWNILLDEESAVVVDSFESPDTTELRRFQARHVDVVCRGDPWYNPLLADDGSWVLRNEACHGINLPRVSHRRKSRHTEMFKD